MRDALVLRHRLVGLAGVPALALAFGCSSAEPPAKADGAGKAEKAEKAEGKGKGKLAELRKKREEQKARTAAKGERPGIDDDDDAPVKVATPEGDDHHHTPSAPPPPGTPAQYLPIPGDPPYVDGYNPEEESCPSGNWCGTAETAAKITPTGDSTPKQMDCPARITGAHDPSPLDAPAYAGLPNKRQMQGAFNEGRTQRMRSEGKADACCYHWFEYCSGRPLLDGSDSVVATPKSGTAWVDDAITPAVAELSDEARLALARAWLDDALREHASVASFSRAALELMAVAAPPELVAGCMQSGLDEVDHARRCFALASAYAGRAVGPGPLPSLSPRGQSLPQLAIETFLEGCVGETVATLVAERSLAVATDEAVCATLRVIIEDESRHAALAWRTIAWALGHGGNDVRTALAAMLEHPPVVEPGDAPLLSVATRSALRHHGRLDPAMLAQSVADAWHDIVAPMLAELVGRRPVGVAASTA